MAKSIRLRIFRIFQSCRPKSAPSTTTPTTLAISNCHCSVPNPPPSPSSDVDSCYLRRKDPHWHIVDRSRLDPSPRLKIDSDDGDDLFSPFSLPKPSYRKAKEEMRRRNINTRRLPTKSKKKKKKKKIREPRYRRRTSSSSTETTWLTSDDGYGCDTDEMDTLIGSALRSAKSGLGRRRILREWMPVGAPCSGAEKKVKQSFAVVKRSEDPFRDFKRSMVEMVMEKQLYEEAELRELLRWFLSLNTSHHHATILRAFSEVWHVMFPVGSLATSP